MNVPILGGNTPVSKAQDVTPAAAPSVRPVTPRDPRFNATFGIRDSSQVELPGKVEQAPPAPEKSVSELRSEFKSSRASLRLQNEDDRAVVDHIRKMVDGRSDLSSKEKEWLYAAELHAYSSDQVMRMTGWEKREQPWSPKQEERFRALADTHSTSKQLLQAITPQVEQSNAAAVPGEVLKSNNPWAEAARRQAAGPSQSPANSTPPADGTPPVNPAPTGNGGPVIGTPPELQPDPMVRLWEMRRQEAQDMFNDFKMLLQMQMDSKARILASRQAFFWKMYEKHTGFLCETWRR